MGWGGVPACVFQIFPALLLKYVAVGKEGGLDDLSRPSLSLAVLENLLLVASAALLTALHGVCWALLLVVVPDCCLLAAAAEGLKLCHILRNGSGFASPLVRIIPCLRLQISLGSAQF